MIKYVKQEDIDRSQWDRLIDHAPNGLIYASSMFLDLVCDKKWDAVILFSDDRKGYRAVMPLPYRKKWGVNYIYQPLFTQQLGLFSLEKIDDELLAVFLKTIPLKYKLVHTVLNSDNPHDNRKQTSGDYLAKKNFLLPIGGSYEAIQKGYSKNLRRNLKKAHAQNLQLQFSVDVRQIIDLFRHNRGRTVTRFDDNAYLLLGAIAQQLKDSGKMESWGVIDADQKLLAGILMVKSNRRWIFLFSGNSEEGREKNALPFLLDRFIALKQHEAQIFDFEGGNEANLARFYASFGASETLYWEYCHAKFPINLIQKIKRGINK